MVKEQLTRRTVAVGAALGIALGASACENPFQDPNEIADCPSGWGSDTTIIGPASGLTMADATARLEAGRTELVSRLHQELGVSSNAVRTEDIPGKYKTAAALLIEQTNDYWYDTNKANLDTPHEQFCIDYLYRKNESPAYVQAEAALKASGINMPGDTNE